MELNCEHLSDIHLNITMDFHFTVKMYMCLLMYSIEQHNLL